MIYAALKEVSVREASWVRFVVENTFARSRAIPKDETSRKNPSSATANHLNPRDETRFYSE